MSEFSIHSVKSIVISESLIDCNKNCDDFYITDIVVSSDDQIEIAGNSIDKIRLFGNKIPIEIVDTRPDAKFGSEIVELLRGNETGFGFVADLLRIAADTMSNTAIGLPVEDEDDKEEFDTMNRAAALIESLVAIIDNHLK